MKNIELRSFRRNEGHKHMCAGNRDKELSCANHLFCSMSLAFICFILLFVGICVVNATVTYDADTNTIFLENGTNTLASTCIEINNASVLSYDSGTNTYTLSAYIIERGEGKGVMAHLHLKNTILVFNNTVDNRYYIETNADLVIENMSIKAADASYPWLIWGCAHWNDYSANITGSDISGGQIVIQPNGFKMPRVPTIIKNNRFHDITTVWELGDIYWESALAIKQYAGTNATIYNNTFENIHIKGSFNPGPGILWLNNVDSCKVDKIYISNYSLEPAHSRRGGVTFYGANTLSAEITNFEIKDGVGDGLSGKEYGNVSYSNGTITNVSGCGIFLYHWKDYGIVKYWIWNVTIDGAEYGIYANAQSSMLADIYDVRINNVNTAFRLGESGANKFYITNSKATSYNTLYDIQLSNEAEQEICWYELMDTYVVDTSGYPVENASLTIEAVNPDVCNCSINRKLESLTQTVTLSNGHTPLPAEDETKTVTLLSRRVTYSTDKTYTYTIKAEKDGYNATVTVTPNASWYREDPNTYPGPGKGTVIITLPLTTAPSLNITNVNATAITSNSTTITWVTDKESDTKVTYTTNPSNLGTHWQNESSQTLTHSIQLSELDVDTPYYFMVYSTDTAGNTANSTASNFSTPAAIPDNATTVILQSPNDVTDNRLRDAIPDAVLGSTSFIDVGRINTEGNYRDVLWFDLTQLNTTAVIKTAKLSLFWYYVTGTRNTSTTVEIYRPVAWSDNHVTWNTRTNGVAWDNLGGDWYDRTNVAQGTTPYAAVTFPVGAADNVYHEFDVTELVQSYVDGTYENTGFFIKANEVSNSYIAFRSSDWTNASERPKLVVSYGGGDSQQNTLSGTVTSPDSTTGIADATVTLATKDGTEIDTVQADFTGHYEFTTVLPGDYNINATKHGYWPDSNPVTVNASEPATANIVLCQKGDFNTNSESADAGDLAMMADATVNATLRDVTYDLDGDGNPADEADLTLLKDVSVGVAELE